MEEGPGEGPRWCVDCGAEHAPWAEQCAFCGGALGPDEPVPPTGFEVGHEMGEVDVRGLEPDELAYVELVLGSMGVVHRVEGGALRLAEVDRAAVDEVLGDLSAGPGVADVGQVQSPGEPEDRAPVIASTSRRVAARLLGGIVWVLCVLLLVVLLAATGVLGEIGYVPGFEMLLVAEVALVAVFGWDVGKLMLGVRVVDARAGGMPGWRRSFVRSAVLWGPYLASTWAAWAVSGLSQEAAVALAWAGPVWFLAVIASISTGPDRRGWHDRAAGTKVVGLHGSTLVERTRQVARASRQT